MTSEHASTKQMHLILQGKGGSGKTVAAVMLAQVLKSLDNQKVVCIDSDPVNATFSQYTAIGAQLIELMDENMRIMPRRFDEMMEAVISGDGDTFVIDTGSQTFLELSSYIVEAQAIDLLQELGISVFIHVPVTGGPGMMDTLSGLTSIARSFPDSAQIVVWLNEYFGPIEADGKNFTAMKTYTSHKERIHSLIRLPKQNPQTTERDIAEMLQRHQTFEEAIRSEDTFTMAKRRLKVASEQILGHIQASL